MIIAVIAVKDGVHTRVPLSTLLPGKPCLHFGPERIEVETIGDIKRELTERGFEQVRIID